jgi:chorismate mutase
MTSTLPTHTTAPSQPTLPGKPTLPGQPTLPAHPTLAIQPAVPTLPVHRRTRNSPETAIDASTAPEEVPVPTDQAGIDKLRLEIDSLDAELVKLILHRTAVSHAIGMARKTLGGPKIVYSREMAILERFRALGPAGTDLAMMLLAMGRGKLGRK